MLDPIYQEPVRLNMAFAESRKISGQIVVTILSIQRFSTGDGVYHIPQQLKVQSSLLRKFQVFSKAVL